MFDKDDKWLMQGDCLERMKEIPSDSADAAISDLPYGTTRCKWDSIILLDEMWDQLKRIVKPNGAIVLTAQTPFDKVLGASNLSMLKYEWIWEKPSATGHLNAKKMPMKAHENALVFYKKLPTYNPQKTTGHREVNNFYTRKSGECYGNANSLSSGGGSTERFPRSVLKFANVTNKDRLHPTQKPVELMEYFISTYTIPGDIVVDPTMGVGTTGVAAKNLNRKFIGIELDLDYFNIALDRIEKA